MSPDQKYSFKNLTNLFDECKNCPEVKDSALEIKNSLLSSLRKEGSKNAEIKATSHCEEPLPEFEHPKERMMQHLNINDIEVKIPIECPHLKNNPVGKKIPPLH